MPLLATVAAPWLAIAQLAGAAALALALWRLLRTLGVDRTGRLSALALALPATVLDVALGGNDPLWTAACLIALDAAIGRRHAAMLLWFALALAIDRQAVLFVPFVLAVLIGRRADVALWLLAAATGIAALLFPLAPGASAFDLATLYFRPAAALPALSSGAPNIWLVAEALLPSATPRLAGLALAGGIGASAWYVAHVSARLPGGARLLPAALLACLITAGLLPHLPASAGFPAALIALAQAVATGERRAWRIAALAQAGSALALAGALLDQSLAGTIGFIALASATWLLAVPVIRPAANDNAPTSRVWRRTPMRRVVAT